MRLFRSGPREHCVASMLRHMEDRAFDEAYRELKRYRDGPVPPPHALWRLGRWLLEKGRAKQAKLALRLFLDIYHAHQDRREVMLDLALALKALGQEEESAALVEDAENLGRKRVAGKQAASTAG